MHPGMLILIASLLAFGAVALLVAGLVISRRTDAIASRLETIATDSAEILPWHEQRKLARASFFETLMARLAGFMPNSDGDASIRDGLIEAGFRRPGAVSVFLGAKLAFALLLPLLFVSTVVAMGGNLSAQVLPGIGFAVLGFYLPTLYLWDKASRRKLEITQNLPDALDLMVVCVEAGLGLDAAMVKVAHEVELTSPVLSGELSLVNREIRTGAARVDALRHLARRTGVQDVQSLVAVLVQTDRLGTSVAAALRAQADSLRVRRRQRAEEQAHKTGVKLVFPLVLCIFPGLLVILLAPGMLRVIRALGGISQ
jgi:tight adherence protein C